MHRLTTKQFGTVASILIGIGILVAFITIQPKVQFREANLATSSRLLTPAPPTVEQLQELKNSPAVFQYLISYTSKGFEPSSLEIKKNDTVRFSNNSSEQLWIASVGSDSSKIYPGTSNCGASAFDSCGPIKPGNFWEFTFTQSGIYGFQNNADTAKSGNITITVK